MEKNINMQNVDELCIKYVLNELDPAELPLIEQAMREDSNVLIEVESLRSTLRRLEKLPHTTPPVGVHDKVLYVAKMASMKRKRTKQMKIWSGFLAAAAIILGFGIYFYPNHSVQVIAETEIEATPSLQATQAGVSVPAQQNGLFRAAVNAPSDVAEPWVDRQNVIRLNISVTPEGFIQMGTDQQHLANTSGLRPVEQPSRPSSYPVMRDIQLTRTNR